MAETAVAYTALTYVRYGRLVFIWQGENAVFHCKYSVNW